MHKGQPSTPPIPQRIVADGGRIVLVGNRGKAEVNFEMMARKVSILGFTVGSASPQEHKAIYSAILAGLENGTLRPVVGQQFPLAEASQAHQAIRVGNASGNIVLVP